MIRKNGYRFSEKIVLNQNRERFPLRWPHPSRRWLMQAPQQEGTKPVMPQWD
jgi:hypothetical protein